MAQKPITVLFSPDPARAAGNPYVALLIASLEAQQVDVRPFSMLAVLRGQGDAVHVHWPESGLAIRQPRAAASRLLRFLLSLLAARLRGMPVLWTVHNLRSHERLHPRLEVLFWAVFPRLVTGWFSLSEAGVEQVCETVPILARAPVWVTPHGHYRGAYPVSPSRAEARATLGIDESETVLVHVGYLRAYKNAPSLISAFRGARSASRLVVAGSCHPPALEVDLRAAAGDDSSIDLQPRRLDDEELVTLLAASDLVVLPYRETFNSGMALLALSAERPVLLPRTPVYEELREKVGDRWVLLYDGDISPAGLDDAVSALVAPAGPALGPAFDWSAIGERTAEAYRSLAKGRLCRRNRAC